MAKNNFFFGKLAADMMADKAMRDAAQEVRGMPQLIDLLAQYGIRGQKAMEFLIDFSMIDMSDEIPLIEENNDKV